MKTDEKQELKEKYRKITSEYQKTEHKINELIEKRDKLEQQIEDFENDYPNIKKWLSEDIILK